MNEIRVQLTTKANVYNLGHNAIKSSHHLYHCIILIVSYTQLVLTLCRSLHLSL